MGLLTEIAGYLGGALVLSGGAAVAIPAWSAISAPARFGFALVLTLLLAAGAFVVRRASSGGAGHEAKLRLASTLGALAAGAAAITVAIPASDRWQALVASLAALAMASAGYGLVRGAPLLVTAWIASAALVGTALDHADAQRLVLWVTAYAVLAAGWLLLGVRTWGGLITEPGVAGLLGGVTGLGAAEAATTEGRGMAVYGLALGLGFAAGCFGLYLDSRRWPALVPAVLIALVVPATALAALFHSVLGAGLVVVVVGLLLLIVGWVALVSGRPGPPAGTLPTGGGPDGVEIVG